MRNCKFKDLIDDYLLNRLTEENRQKFEEHYFNCPSCFEKIVERDELISIVKNKGHMIFQHDEYVVEEAKGETWFEKITSFLTPKQWATVAVSACLILIVIFGVIPDLKRTSPQFFINEDLVRGGSITLISPIFETNIVPSQFEWKKAGEDIEYRIYIYDNGNMLWSTTTKENFVVLPEKINKLLTSGGKYSWQVKAFSPEGTLVSVSSKVQFKINRIE